MKTLINQSMVKKFALECSKYRYHKFSRVSKDFLTAVESVVREDIRRRVTQAPSCGKTLFSLLLCFLVCAPAFAITDAEGVQCIMGEARNQPFSCQVATGEALRNRGTTKGVYGCKVAINEPQAVWNKAKRAWNESKTSNLVKGASFWESTDFNRPKWSYDMTQTAQIGKHVFYRK